MMPFIRFCSALPLDSSGLWWTHNMGWLTGSRFGSHKNGEKGFFHHSQPKDRNEKYFLLCLVAFELEIGNQWHT
jgi:hypothetical protein